MTGINQHLARYYFTNWANKFCCLCRDISIRFIDLSIYCNILTYVY